MRILRFANFAHAELMTWGAYAAFVLITFARSMNGVLGGKIGPFSFGLTLIVATVLAARADGGGSFGHRSPGVQPGCAAWPVT